MIVMIIVQYRASVLYDYYNTAELLLLYIIRMTFITFKTVLHFKFSAGIGTKLLVTRENCIYLVVADQPPPTSLER